MKALTILNNCGMQLAWQVLLADHVNKEILKGKWLMVKADVRTWWDRMTDEDVDQIQGDAERFISKLQERYEYGREQAEKELDDFLIMPDRERSRSA
jgi:uncharacterized protein YjbJ (UPF0337 family)